jgi:hypothetical protein
MGGTARALIAAVVSGVLCAACSATGDDTGAARAESARGSSGSSTASPDGGTDQGSSNGQGGDAGSPGESGSASAEVLAPTESDSGLPGLDDDPTPLVDLPLPDADSAVGALVPGYPDEGMPVAPRSTITTSSVSPADDRLQVALTARTSLGVERALRFYRLHFGRLGFTETPTTAVGGSSAAAFERGTDSVVVTVTPGRSASKYSLYGTLSAGQG